MSKYIKIKKGLNLNMKGEAAKTISVLPMPETFAIKPADFINIVPKLLVKPGDEVKAGSPLFSSKDNPDLIFTSPVSGEVVDILRGDKRKVLQVQVLPDKSIEYVKYHPTDPDRETREFIVKRLLEIGAWPLIRQRPYGCIADPVQIPKAIFISGFDSNPLAPDLNFIFGSENTAFQTGINVLRKLTSGIVHITVHADKEPSRVFTETKGVQLSRINGPHPSGNVGVQIHHIDPVNKGETVWCINAQDVPVIGRVFSEGILDLTKIIAVTGSSHEKPAYYKIITGSSVKHILNDAKLKPGEHRIISGNVLSGRKITEDGYLGFYETQLTVIPENHEPEFMGWISPGLNKFSVSRSYFSWLTPGKKYDLDTNMHGEERPFVITGQYEKVFPMDIYPVHLLKAVLIEDLELMENLGIYEVVEEDFALCEFVCTSKIESQAIIRRGLDLIRKEMG